MLVGATFLCFLTYLFSVGALCQFQDDGELYDEFGNLKKKFRAKTQQAEAGRTLPGAGRAGWEVEELGTLAFGTVNFPSSFFADTCKSPFIIDHPE